MIAKFVSHIWYGRLFSTSLHHDCFFHRWSLFWWLFLLYIIIMVRWWSFKSSLFKSLLIAFKNTTLFFLFGFGFGLVNAWKFMNNLLFILLYLWSLQNHFLLNIWFESWTLRNEWDIILFYILYCLLRIFDYSTEIFSDLH